MRVEATGIAGAWLCTPVVLGDTRGSFTEWFRADLLEEATGVAFRPQQGNVSVSARGVVRGLHFTTVPPGQMKFVQCVNGEVFDVFVDLRVGSPTFGEWGSVTLDPGQRRAVFLEGGIGHGFAALHDGSTVVYLTSSIYDAEVERAVSAVDPSIGIRWPGDIQTPMLSQRDSRAPTLREALEAGELPLYDGAPKA